MTDSPITPADLQCWRELADAASPGPWAHVLGEDAEPMWDICNCGADNSGVDHAIFANSQFPEGSSAGADAAFIAAARDAVPRLLSAYAAEHDSAGAWASRAAASGLQVEACVALMRRARTVVHGSVDDFALREEMRAMVEGWGS